MVGRILLGGLFLVAGMLHLLRPGLYLPMMLPALPHPLGLVYLSGAAEMLGGLGVLLAQTRRAAAWGLILLLLAVWPANFYMAMVPERFPGIPALALWARLPLQLPLIWWAYLYTRKGGASAAVEERSMRGAGRPGPTVESGDA